MTEKTVKIAPKKLRWKRIILCLIIVAIISGGGGFFIVHMAKKNVKEFLKANGVTYDSLDVNWKREFVAHDVKITFLKDQVVTVALVSGKVNFSGTIGKNVDLKHISYHFGNDDISVPLLSLRDYENDAKADSTTNGDYFNIKNIKFKKALMPVFLVKRKTPNEEQNVSYKNIIYNDLDKGIIKRITIDNISLNGKNFDKNGLTLKNELVTMTAANIAIDNFNVKHTIDYYTYTATDTTNPFIDLMSAWSVKEIIIDKARDDKTGIHLAFDSLSGTKFSSRLLPFSLFDFINVVDSYDLNNFTSPELFNEIKDKGLVIFSSVGAADMKIKGMVMNNDRTLLNMQNMNISYQNGYLDLAVNDLEITSDNKVSTLDNFSISGLHFPNAKATLEELYAWLVVPNKDMNDDDEVASDKTGVALLPRFKKIHLSKIFIPSTDNGSTEESIPLKINSVDVDADFSLGSIPTSLTMAIKGIEFSVADWDKQTSGKRILGMEQVQQEGGLFEALGYNTIKTDVAFDASWNSEKEIINVKEMSINYVDIANISLSGTLGNVNQALFSDNPMTIGAAALSVNIQNVDVAMNVDNFMKRYEKLYDLTTGEKFSEKRKQAAMNARLVVPLFLDADQSKNVGYVLQSFIQNGGTLKVHAKAKSKQGFGFFDMLEMQLDPRSFFKKIDLSAQIQY